VFGQKLYLLGKNFFEVINKYFLPNLKVFWFTTLSEIRVENIWIKTYYANSVIPGNRPIVQQKNFRFLTRLLLVVRITCV